ncbi:hypothetical protein [Helicobacter bizzozeronii]|uniref:hypothetical protein n=1 Tax=Helicobacter bizzozeronii TaxID=56877 RepID=UPI000CEEF4B7|nr:hypothetical protein [Helicobacter bizzozeronii]
MNPEKNDKNTPQNADKKEGKKNQVVTPKLSVSEKYIRIGKLYEKLEKLDEERAKILAEIKELKSS